MQNINKQAAGQAAGSVSSFPAAAGAFISSSAPVPGTCSACGHVNMPGEMFCMNCGVQLAPVASVPPPPPTPVSAPPPEPAEIRSSESAAIACHSCGQQVSANEQYCNNCGIQINMSTGTLGPLPARVSTPTPSASQSSSCPNCGYAIQPGEKFCNNCGLQLAAGPGLAPSYSSPAAPSPDPSGGLGSISGKLVVQATRAEISLPTGKKELYIGRSDPVRNIFPEIDLTIHGGDSSGVSRKHARLTLQDAKIYLEDLNSTNFTFVNRQKLQPGLKHPLKHGDEIRLGLLALEFYIN